ncbi:Glutathione S-transferase Mu 3 [Sparganum proliferum]
MSQKPILGYWKIRGLAQAIRLLFHYCGEDYVEELYEAGGPPTFSVESWLKVKFNKGLDFPNITQSSAILEYVADKHGMLPGSAEERAVLHMLQAELADFRGSYLRVVYNPDFNKLKQGFLDSLPEKLQAWSNYLGKKSWLTGDKINYPDFNLYDLLDALRTLEPPCLDKFPNLKTYMERFENLEPIKKFQSSDAYMARPFNNVMAAWRGDT